MFGSKNKEPHLAGAADKQETIRKMRAAGRGDPGVIEEEELASQAVLIVMVFALATIFAFLLTDGDLTGSVAWHPTGVERLDHFLVGAGAFTFMGDADIDRLILVLARGLAFFALTGAVPFLAFIAVKAAGKARLHPLVACWLISAALLLVCGLLGDTLTAVLGSIAGSF